MVVAKNITFTEAKTLSTIKTLREIYGFTYNSAKQRFEIYSKNPILLSNVEYYPLKEFISDYYEMDFIDFRDKLGNRLGSNLNERGYIVGMGANLMPVRNLAHFSNKENKFNNELGQGRERGTWIKSVYQDVGITTSQTNIIVDFISQTINGEHLNSNDVIMLKYLKKIDKQTFSIYKIFKSVDIRDKPSLIRNINTYMQMDSLDRIKTIVKILIDWSWISSKRLKDDVTNEN